jgi:hypothetical protein
MPAVEIVAIAGAGSAVAGLLMRIGMWWLTVTLVRRIAGLSPHAKERVRGRPPAE